MGLKANRPIQNRFRDRGRHRALWRINDGGYWSKKRENKMRNVNCANDNKLKRLKGETTAPGQ
jgi:hypothetical protein